MEHSILDVVFKGQVLQSVPLDRPVLTIGRLKENDVVIDNLSVSRLHARVWVGEDTVILEDQGSGNGCRVNGRRVTSTPITAGDEILIGKHQLVLRSGGSEASPGPAGAAPSSPWDGARTYFLSPEDPGSPAGSEEEEEEEPEAGRPEGAASFAGHAGLILQLHGQLDRIVSMDRSPFVIGRAPDCDLVLAGEGVSRQHARIERKGERFEIEDLGGVNGTFVGGELISRQELCLGDEIGLDAYQITFVLEDRPISEEIHVSRGGGPPAQAPMPEQTAFAETLPPDPCRGACEIPEEGDAGELDAPSDEGPLEATLGLGGLPREREADAVSFAFGADDGSEPERVALELEIDVATLPEPLRTALVAASRGGLRLPVTLRLRGVGQNGAD